MEQSRLRVWRRIFVVVVALAALASATAYGFYAHRDHRFPYRITSRLWRAVFPGQSRRFHAARPGTGQDTLSLEEIDRLARIPYLRGYRPASGRVSVRVHDPKLAFDGLNLFTSGHAPQVTLMDMDGAVLKTWTADVRKAFPGLAVRRGLVEGTRFCRSAWLLPDGGMVAMFEDIGLVRLDSASQIRWALPARVHHDFALDEGGSIWALTHARRPLPELHFAEPVMDDFVAEVSPDGRLVREVSILDSFRRSLYAPILAHLPRRRGILHANSVQVFDGSLAARSPLFRKGNVLISLRNIDTIAVLDPREVRIVWALTGQWHRQHCARLIANGHLLLFDNLGSMRAASQVLEFDPFTQEIFWRFGGIRGEELFSRSNGFVRRLPNGNTLVGESNFGRVLEVTPDRRIAWEFVNPNRAGKKNELIATLFDLRRVPRDLPFFKPSTSAAISTETRAPLR